MRKYKISEELLNGKCNLCGGTYSKAAMMKHIETCMGKKKSYGSKSERKGNSFHIVVEGAHQPEYWMHLNANAEATLKDLDSFLRDTWLECCGHMSAFTIQKTRYISGSGINPMRINMGFKPGREMNMNIPLSKVLIPKLKFYHEYDFGDTTELVLKVVSEHEMAFEGKPIKILARNEPPQIFCNVCGGIATQVCSQCIYEDTGWLCDKCGREHECGEDMLLPVVNSPRVGMCGYTG